MLPLLLLGLLQDSIPPSQPEWEGTAEFGLTALSGNHDNFNSSLKAEAKTADTESPWILGFEYAGVRESQASQTDKRLYLGALEHHRYLDREGKLFFYGKGSGRRDVPNGLELRADLGIGMGFLLGEEDGTHFRLEFGPSILREDNVGVDGLNLFSARAAASFTTPLLEDWSLRGKNEYFRSTEESADQAFTSDLDLRWQLQTDWFMDMGWSLAWDGSPGPGFGRTDTRLVLTLGTSF